MGARISAIGWVYGLGLVALGCVLVSLLGNILASVTEGADFGVFTLANYADLLDDPKLPAVFLRTLAQGGGTVAIMLAFAVPIAWLIARTDIPWKNGILTLFTAQLAMPGFITAMTYVWMFNPNSGIVNKLAMQLGIASEPLFNIYGLGWICFLQGLVLVPAAVFMILPSFQNVDATLEEAALVSGVPRRRAFRRVVLPLLAPGIVAATLLFFIIGIELFDFIGLIGMPGRVEVLSLWVYDAMHPSTGFPDYGAAGAASMVMFAVSAVAIAFYVRLLRNAQRYSVLRGNMRIGEMQSLGRWRGLSLAFIGLWFLLAFVVPIVTLVWVSLLPYLQPPSSRAMTTLTLRNFAFAPQYLAGPLLNTLAVAGGVIVLALAWSASASWIVTRSRSRFGRWLDVVIFLTPAVPSMAAAVAFQMMGIAVNQWVPLYGSMWLIIIAMSTRMLAFCTRTVNALGVQMHAELDEAAYACGVSRMVAFRRIFLPIVTPALAYAGLMVGMLVARELTLPLMMDTGRMKLVATLIFDLQTNGSFGAASAVGLYMVVVLVALVFVARRFAGGAAPVGAVEAKRRRPRRQAKKWRPVTFDDRLEARQASQGGGNARIRIP
jgi:iron(III) transport system permease protein